VSARRGFTLVELMLAILILAILMTLVYGVVVSTVQAQERIEQISNTSEIGPAILAQVRADLEAAFIPVPPDAKAADAAPEFFLALDRKAGEGDRDRVDFVTAALAFGADREGEEPKFQTVNETGYQVIDSREEPGVGVLYRREDFGADADLLRGGRLAEMYDRVVHFNLSFWDGTQWRPQWSAKAERKLPLAVRVELRILVKDRDDPNVLQTHVTTVTYAR
jgi:general secretion pathway protein J